MSIAQPAVTPIPSFRARVLTHPLLRIVLGVAAVMLPISLTLALIHAVVPQPLRVVWPMPLAALLSFLSYRLFATRVEKRLPSELALPGAALEVGAGVVAGAALGLKVAVILAVMGAFVITGSSTGWDALLKCLPEQIMVATFEELIFRAVLFRIVDQRWGTRVALAVSFVLFALAHLPNDNISALAVLDTAVVSLALCAAYMMTGRVWLPIGIHFGWNFLYDGVFAVPLSGHAARGWLQVSLPGPEWLTGGAYGVEASVLTLLVWGIATVLMLKRAQPHHLA
ncbi:CPBP family intramembrane metalloprotease [Duganella sp. FT109W]|uniref:CPBP family intramembrane metalloprotease n=1 Tax=Duganella margarita TaxID=2692170 RepID=A0ABW9WEY2_9BURK|nr:CPBP family intramembrane glutamic endopeptidase [Duganella margarita]MYN39667.1 CPBP family intramembrane metalloprotease [Duganella margarita]